MQQQRPHERVLGVGAVEGVGEARDAEDSIRLEPERVELRSRELAQVGGARRFAGFNKTFAGDFDSPSSSVIVVLVPCEALRRGISGVRARASGDSLMIGARVADDSVMLWQSLQVWLLPLRFVQSQRVLQ